MKIVFLNRQYLNIYSGCLGKYLLRMPWLKLNNMYIYYVDFKIPLIPNPISTKIAMKSQLYMYAAYMLQPGNITSKIISTSSTLSFLQGQRQQFSIYHWNPSRTLYIWWWIPCYTFIVLRNQSWCFNLLTDFSVFQPSVNWSSRGHFCTIINFLVMGHS